MEKHDTVEDWPSELSLGTFVIDENSQLDFILCTEVPQTIRVNDIDGLKIHMGNSVYRARMIVISQPFSWGRLRISRAMFECFVALSEAMQEVWEIVYCFGSRSSDLEQAYSPCAWKQRKGKLEMSYVFKYPEKKLHDGEELWVIRQTGVFQQFDTISRKATWLLVLPNPKAYPTEKAEQVMIESQHPLHPHSCFLLEHIPKWRWYIFRFEKEFQDLAEEILNVEIERQLDFSETYKHISGLRFIETNISPLIPIFAAQKQVVRHLRSSNNELSMRGDIDKDQSRDFNASLDDVAARLSSFEMNAEFLLSRIKSTTQMASDTITLKSQNATEHVSKYMLKDSTAMRVITLVTLVFLPATFVAGFFGMGFFTTDNDAGGAWVVTPYIWVYFVIAIPLTAITLVYWRWRSRRARAREFLVSAV
ncbi:hypothetical protein F5Y15DRAFT_363995 [Xylariaceae sp. FL0016]|nr:hypothetical protein F5Y15DRAFT_363995 [Xylariaceae sp. FL0016]